MFFRQIFDPSLAQYAYLIGCPASGEAILIDPERDIDRYLNLAAEQGLRIVAVTETHIHADYLSGVRQMAHQTGAKVYASGCGGPDWQFQWLNDDDIPYQVLNDGDVIQIGNVELKAVHTPGHTPEHMSFWVTDGGTAGDPMGVVSGDFVFVGDLGRPDLLESAAGQAGAMEPSARLLFHSAHSFLEQPDHLQIWPGHGAGSACGKALGQVPTSTVGYERRHNPSLLAVADGEDSFVQRILDGQPEPPLYFARMKNQNRQGPPLLDALPQPERRSADDAARSAAQADSGTRVLDTRPSATEFLEGHLAGSLHAPFTSSFLAIAGSYVEPDCEIHLIIDPEHLPEAVRQLVRIGLDKVTAWTPIDELDGAEVSLTSTPGVDFKRGVELAQKPQTTILDVRRASEAAAGHLPGSLNIAHTRLAARIDEIPKDHTLVVHCQAGIRAAAATAYLRLRGFKAHAVVDNFTHAILK